MTARILSFFDEATFTVSYLVSDPVSARAAVIDPVLDFDQKSGRTRTGSADKILLSAQHAGLTIEWVLETHAHADHLSAGAYIRAQIGAKIAIGEHICAVQEAFGPIFNIPGWDTAGAAFDRLLKDGEVISLGSLTIETWWTPGHTPACVSYKAGDALFVGDTLFMPDYGTARTDFPGGDARQLYRSIQRFFQLPDATRLFLCHDYKAPGRDQFVWETTVGAQRAQNIHIRQGISEDAFADMRTKRDTTLQMPALIIPSIQVNLRAGALPAPEANGVSYLKVPLNRL